MADNRVSLVDALDDSSVSDGSAVACEHEQVNLRNEPTGAQHNVEARHATRQVLA